MAITLVVAAVVVVVAVVVVGGKIVRKLFLTFFEGEESRTSIRSM